MKERESGIELLRIFAALGVVVLHYNDGRGLLYVSGFSKHVLYFLECISICAVDIFVIISGFFLSNSKKREPIKILDLYGQRVYIKIIELVSLILFGSIKSISVGNVFELIIPASYYIVLYSVLYLISPYINVIMEKLDETGWRNLLVIIILIFSVWNTFVDLLEEFIGHTIFGLSTIGAMGSQQGFNIVNFVVLYIIGAYIRHVKEEKICIFNSRYLLFSLYFLCIVVTFILAVCEDYLETSELRAAWVYHNPLVIMMAVILVVLFSSIKFKNKVVNVLGKASFTCYLFHIIVLDNIKFDIISKSPYIMLVHLVITLIVTYILSWLIYMSWMIVKKPIFNVFYKMKKLRTITYKL